MSSSMLTGERRWSSARRGGMTVLGKVAVPKPLNLPSQRLENHGLDPNVEIVPKGSHSWGSRSSSASNPWGSSVVSPNADSTVSPRHLSGRPSSSGGSGTRPSTAGSDRIHEVGGSAWGPNSRPSSASGPLTSNQASVASSRPRSADTRPGSSQLSRFAEHVADSSVAWGPAGTVEKLVLNSKSDNFSLSSGDFPTLGKNSESEDNHPHGRPSSASDRVASPKERAQTDVKGGNADTWTRDGAHHVEDGVHPSAEKWHGDHPQYFNPNIPRQHFDAWRGPPMNPAGVWFRGPPGGPPYPPVAHGGFPIEPFPYYRPQIPPTLANPQPVPPRGPGPRGHHPNNGEFYRPPMPDAFMRPGMPMRPGFYPGPVPYDGYYGPPMGYNPNEREIPYMGMPGGPPMYNMYPPQNSSEPGDIQTRAGGGGAGGKMLVTENAELGHSDGVRGPYKVLKKRPNEWGLEEEENLEPTASATPLQKSEQPRKASLNEWGADNRSDEKFYSGRATHGENQSSRISLSHQGHSSDSAILKSPRDKSKAVNESWEKKSEIASPSVEAPQSLPAASKDNNSIQKIEMLNAKVRAFDGREDVVPASVREEQTNRVHHANTKTNNHIINEAGGTPGDSISSPELGGSTEETSQATADTVPAIPRRSHAGVHGRIDHQHKGRFNHHVTVEATEKNEIKTTGKNEEESLTPMLEPIEGPAQRAKLRELAKQRAMQLQKEEEERIREQKAKALAKLEELNRRTLAGDSSAQKLEMTVTSGAAQKDSEESKKHYVPALDADKHVTEQLEKPLTRSATQLDPEESQKHAAPLMDADKHGPQKLGKSVLSGATHQNPKESREQPVLSSDLHFEAPSDTNQEPVVTQSQSVPSKLDAVNTGAEDGKAASNDVSLRRNKRNKQKQSINVESVVSDKQKQRIQMECTVTDKPTQINTSEAQKDHDVSATEIVTSQVDPMHVLSLRNNSNIMQESVGHNRKKNNWSSRNKHKQDEAAFSTASQSPVPQETHLRKAPAAAAIQAAVPNESHPLKTSTSSTSQSPVPKESLPAQPPASTASPSPGPKETHTAKSFAAAASQPPIWKETRPVKASVAATSQPQVPKETLPAKAPVSAVATSQLPVQKETLPAKASVTTASQGQVQKETLPSKASATSQAQVKKESLPAKVSVTAASQSPLPKETHPVKAPLERGQPEASHLDPNLVQLVTGVKDASQQPSSEQSPSLPSEEAYSRVNNQWKPQNSRRMPRNPQALRPGDKFHSTESVVWAPVRSQKKLEPEGEGSQKTAPDATPAIERNNSPVQSSGKSKRAELERYVPKPVAKELAQHGSIQQPVALSSSIQTLDETSEREGSGSQSVKPEVGNGRSSLEPRNEDFKQSKPIRTPGSWRQQDSSEGQHGKGTQHTSFSTSNPSKNVQKSMNQQDTSKVDFSSVPAENKGFHDWDPSDGWSMPEEPTATITVTHVVKDEGLGTGEGRRQPHKGQRRNVNSHDFVHRNNSGGEADKNHIQSAATDMSQAERAISSREGRAISSREGRPSHWQPKSQVNLASSQRGGRYGGGQKDSFEGKKNYLPRSTQQYNKESSGTHQPPSEQFVSENKMVEEASRGERRSDSSRRGPRTPDQSLGPFDNMEEQAADQHYSGFQRGGNQNNRGAGKGNHSRRDWSSGDYENRPQHVAPNRERQRQNAHFEYQPVGSNNNNGKFNNFDEEGTGNMGPRHRERGSGRPTRGAGNFHGQQNRSIRNEAGNE